MDSPTRAATVRLAPGITARYAVGSIGTGGFGTLPGLVLVYYLTDTLGVAALAAGVFVTLAKVWDVVIDPVIGAWSDREFAATGSRRRLMVLGGVLIPVFFTLAFAVPPDLPPVISAAWVFAAFLLAATAFSLFQVPYIAIPAELVAGYDARTRLLAVRVVVLSVAILLFGAGGPALRGLAEDERIGYLAMALVAGLVLGGAFLVTATVAGRRELVAGAAGGSRPPAAAIAEHYRRAIDALRSSRAFRALLATFVLQALATGLMLAGAQYVATWVLGDVDAVTYLFVALIAPAIVFSPVWAAISARIGKTRSFVLATALFIVAALALFGLQWAPGAWVYGPVALVGAAYAGLQALPMAMLPDVIAADARDRGESRSGAFGGAWTAGETAGMALGTTILTIVLAVTGYLESSGGETVAQSPAAVTGIVLAFSVVPAALAALSLIPLGRYPLTRATNDDVANDASNDASDDVSGDVSGDASDDEEARA